MPIVRIDIQAGKSTVYKRDILHSVRIAITQSLGVADDRVMQRIIETPAENIDGPGGERSDRLTVIDISMLPGRDASRKQTMYAAIVSALGERPGIHQRDITVVVHDPAAECFAIGGIMQCTLPGDSDDADFEEPSGAVGGLSMPEAEPPTTPEAEPPTTPEAEPAATPEAEPPIPAFATPDAAVDQTPSPQHAFDFAEHERVAEWPIHTKPDA